LASQLVCGFVKSAGELALVKFSELKTLEGKAIQAIRTEGVFGRLSSLVSTAQQAQIIPGSRVPVNLHLSFTLPTRLREDRGAHAIERAFHVGCLAVPSANGDDISQLSYSVLIGQDALPSKSVARKFHFDFEPAAARNVAESKPTFHLQMCGELSEHHRGAGYSDGDINHLLPSWSQPRVPAQPMSLALVLNWLFIEFGCEAPVRNARANPRWRSIVREAERSVLKPYYEACSTFLSLSANDEESFISKRIYEET
jgi:hypothetical protein